MQWYIQAGMAAYANQVTVPGNRLNQLFNSFLYIAMISSFATRHNCLCVLYLHSQVGTAWYIWPIRSRTIPVTSVPRCQVPENSQFQPERVFSRVPSWFKLPRALRYPPLPLERQIAFAASPISTWERNASRCSA